MNGLRRFLGLYEDLDEFAQDMTSQDVTDITVSAYVDRTEDPVLLRMPSEDRNQWVVEAHADTQPWFRTYRERVGKVFLTNYGEYLRKVDKEYAQAISTDVEELVEEWEQTLQEYDLQVNTHCTTENYK